MNTLFEFTKGMKPDSTSYCPGCTHGIAHRLIMEALCERGDLGRAIGVAPIGCSIVSHNYMNVDMCESTHGRAPAIASGIKRVHPGNIVFTYQGDGDLASIGTGEIIHAAHRGEHITTFFINNAIYGMTGGQMAPTTFIGQKTTTTAEGRTEKANGKPLRMSEMIATVGGAAYVERVALNSPSGVRKAKKAVLRALDVQDRKEGFSFVEFLSTCPTNWGLDPVASIEWVNTDMIPYYPLGNFKGMEG
ncbi:MAG: 2-oxoglutarate oxidoreductase [Clostridiales Family XIII bacterium]|jgi:2-oxoglutarate ferredoxin oxidoreductase subunit beta|nr:2-oxoglutarate oxidoreductase [Clostridiales Family XIII bacterium]